MTFLSNQIETNGVAVNYTIYINECVVTLVLFDGHVARYCLWRRLYTHSSTFAASFSLYILRWLLLVGVVDLKTDIYTTHLYQND